LSRNGFRVNRRGFALIWKSDNALALIELNHCRVSDAGIDELSTLKRLRTLSIDGTDVSDAGIKSLKEAMPDLQVTMRHKGWVPSLPFDLRSAWRKVGATVVWMDSFPGWDDGSDVTTGEIPAFSLEKIESDKLSILPQPDRPFGLEFYFSPTPVSGFKSLGVFKNLQRMTFVNGAPEDCDLGGLADLTGLRLLNVHATVMTPHNLDQIAALSQLRSLDLESTQLTDAGLKQLSGLTRLRALDIARNQITDVGLLELGSLTQMRSLDLGYNSVTDGGLKDIVGFTQLTGLNLNNTLVTDAGMKEVSGFIQLTDLDVGGTRVTDAGVKEIASLGQLRKLNLGFTRLSDQGVKELAGLSQLEELDLMECPVTDAGLKQLTDLKRLKTLNLIEAHVTVAGVKELEAQLPSVRVYGP
jgi:internalin A